MKKDNSIPAKTSTKRRRHPVHSELKKRQRIEKKKVSLPDSDEMNPKVHSLSMTSRESGTLTLVEIINVLTL